MKASALAEFHMQNLEISLFYFSFPPIGMLHNKNKYDDKFNDQDVT